MPDILVRDVPETILAALKARAKRRRRSLQQEVLGILESAAAEPPVHDPAQVAAQIRARLASSGRVFSDSVDLVREDRDR